jgi:hypothetical protein
VGSPDRVAVEYQLHLVGCNTSRTRLEDQGCVKDSQNHMKKEGIGEEIITRPS